MQRDEARVSQGWQNLDETRRARNLAEQRFTREEQWRQQDKAEKRMKEIQEAFQKLGAMIAGAVRGGGFGGGGGRGGGEQDSRAFQLPPRPRREPPRIPQARRRGD